MGVFNRFFFGGGGGGEGEKEEIALFLESKAAKIIVYLIIQCIMLCIEMEEKTTHAWFLLELWKKYSQSIVLLY